MKHIKRVRQRLKRRPCEVYGALTKCVRCRTHARARGPRDTSGCEWRGLGVRVLTGLLGLATAPSGAAGVEPIRLGQRSLTILGYQPGPVTGVMTPKASRPSAPTPASGAMVAGGSPAGRANARL